MPDDYYVSQYSGEEIDALLGRAGAGTVRYDAAQTLTNAQKTQARVNIGSAPDGYGLGGYATQLPGMSCNEAVYNGWYINQGNDNENCPKNGDVALSYGTLLVSAKSYTNVMQFYFPAISNFTGYCIRTSDGTTWTPWEWPNPPMQLGVEYRTTERYLGKPVYVKAVDCGNLPAPGSLKNVSHGVSGCLPIMVTGQMSNTNTIPWKGKFTVSADNINIVLYSPTDESDFSSLTATAILKYTKTTD